MAKGRFVSASISMNEQLASVSLAADYLFQRCLPHLDVEGRMTGNPELIKARVVPLRPEIDSGVIPELLRSLSAAVDHEGRPLVRWYDVNGAKVLEFPGFADHQNGLRKDREAASKFPPFNDMAVDLGKLRSNSGVPPELVRSDSGVGPAQCNSKFKFKSNTSSSSSSDAQPVWAPGREAELAQRMASDADRNALSALLVRVPSKTAWVAEMHVILDGGMVGHPTCTPEQLGQAIRDFLGNLRDDTEPNMRYFRSYAQSASGGSGGKRGGKRSDGPGDDRRIFDSE